MQYAAPPISTREDDDVLPHSSSSKSGFSTRNVTALRRHSVLPVAELETTCVFSNASVPRERTLEGSTTSAPAISGKLMNAALSMVSTPCPIVTLRTRLQPLNAYGPTVFTVPGMAMLVNGSGVSPSTKLLGAQPPNAWYSMDSTLAGRFVTTASLSISQLQNACSGMVFSMSLLFGHVTVCSFLQL